MELSMQHMDTVNLQPIDLFAVIPLNVSCQSFMQFPTHRYNERGHSIQHSSKCYITHIHNTGENKVI